jgi:BON domain
MRWVVMVLPLAVAVGCAHETAQTNTATAGKGFEHAYEQVVSGGQASVHEGGYLVERAGGSAVRVARDSPGGGLSSEVSDAGITARVKSSLGLDQEATSGRIQVGTSAGVVTLSGQAASREEAMKAVRTALDTDGVTAVDSELKFPGMRASR